jgi:serine/threonine protein kinase
MLLEHRDITPKNIFITQKGRAIIGDLGHVKPADDIESVISFAVGTNGFQSPQIALWHGSTKEERKDIKIVSLTFL